MANEESTTNNKYAPNNNNLKVPPIKIVLSSHQSNNAVVNMATSSEEDHSETGDKDNSGIFLTTDNRAENKKSSHNNLSNSSLNSSDSTSSSHQDFAERIARKQSRCSRLGGDNNPEADPASGTIASSSSDRSTSSTPSSESESIASNSTIISEHNHSQQQQTRNRLSFKDDGSTTSSTSTGSASKQDQRPSRSKGPTPRASMSNERSSSSGGFGKKQQEPPTEQSSETSSTSRENNLNSNQRITRSSQRAAQQVKVESNPSDMVANDESTLAENQEKSSDSARKVKRRKGEVQEVEQDNSQPPVQQPPPMANICPADYQLPTHNSFQLYRDIRDRPLKKMRKLTNVQPKIPQGFKEYLINKGPYLLDGNKLGVGLTGAKLERAMQKTPHQTLSHLPNRKRNPDLFLDQPIPLNQRHSAYNIPKISVPPKKLEVGSQLFKLFQDQEASRHQMRIQHLKERERLIMTVEQEILRTYTRAAVADKKQKRQLSACTYLYFQERYHYSTDKVKQLQVKDEASSEGQSSQDQPSDTTGQLADDQHNNESTSIGPDEATDVIKPVCDDVGTAIKQPDNFLSQLQEVDEKWENIRRDMLVRHKNEADSLHAVQSMEWEWKTKELGLCDIRVPFEVEQDLVPKVEVVALDY